MVTTKNTDTRKDCMWGGKPQNTQNTQKSATRSTACGDRNHRTHRKRTACREETTKYTKYTKRRTAKSTASVGQQARHRRIPMSGAAGGDVPLHRLTKSLPLLWHQGTRLHKSTAYKRRGHPEPHRCASAKAREIPHPTEGRRHPVSTRRASAGCEACRTHPLHSGRGLR